MGPLGSCPEVSQVIHLWPLTKEDAMTQDQMKMRLLAAYPEGTVEVVDLTGTEDHYQVYIKSQKFEGLSRIQRHQHVMSQFQEELKTGEVHALTIRTET